MMGIEMRDGRPYYYRKRRISGRVVSVYAGAGEFGHLLSAIDEIERMEAMASREEWRADREAMAAQESAVAAAIRDVDRAVSGALEAAGYHRPGRRLAWMRRRPGGAS